MAQYRVKLQNFEGPLDLLLFFIKRDELNIYDIPISKITNDFVEYLHYMQTLDLDVASEFIVMAATLMQIKVKMLLPREEGEEEEDPREELVRRLLEYKRFKETAEQLEYLDGEARKIYYRQAFHQDPKRIALEDQEEGLKDITLFNLISSFKKVMDRIPKKVYHDVEMVNVTIDEQISYLLDFFRIRKEGTLLELISHMTEKIRIIVTFIALLELMKNQVLGIKPIEGKDDILVYKIAHSTR
jgi:segregation and condensation protein A